MPTTVFPAVFDLEALNGTNGFRIFGSSPASGFGRTVSLAKDVNGDGFADIVMGTPQSSNGLTTTSGSSYVFYGAASGFLATEQLAALDLSTGFRFDGGDFDLMGTSVSGFGDINGDGFGDVILGVPGADTTSLTDNGAVHVFYGTDTGFRAGFRVDGPAGGANFGATLAGVGDVNGDGFDDFMSLGSTSYIVFGFPDPFGMGTSPLSFSASILNSNRVIRVENSLSPATSVAAAGDFNGDGVDDIIVGSNPGSAYVVYGSTTGFGSFLDPFALRLDALDGTDGFRLVAPNLITIGQQVAGAGDINGDGLGDILVSSATGPSGFGAAYVVFGTDKGVPAQMNLDTLDGVNGFRVDISSGIIATVSGVSSLSTAGDFNGDGLDDFIVGASGYDAGGMVDSGAVFVVFGNAGGFAPSLDLGLLDGTTGFRIDGISGVDGFGTAVSGGEDINGDGYDDIVVGAPGAGANYGETYVIFGGPSNGAVSLIGTAVADTLRGSAFGDRIEGLAGNDRIFGYDGADTLLGDNGKDRLIGGAGADSLSGGAQSDRLAGGAGADVLDGGDGRDTLDYLQSDAGVVVDLDAGTGGGAGSHADGDVISGIENVIGSTYADTITGDAGANVIRGGVGADSLVGGAGTDTLDYRKSGAAVSIDLDAGTAGGAGSGAEGDVISGFERVFGSAYADTISGDAGDNLIRGGAGADSLVAAQGIDTVDYRSAKTGVTVNLATSSGSAGDAAGDFLDGFENIFGGRGDDDMTGDGGDNLIRGGKGNDTLSGLAGEDRLEGGTGDDWFEFGAGNDSLYGGSGSDTAVFVGNVALFNVTVVGGGELAVQEIATGDTDSLFFVESVVFDDTTLTF